MSHSEPRRLRKPTYGRRKRKTPLLPFHRSLDRLRLYRRRHRWRTVHCWIGSRRNHRIRHQPPTESSLRNHPSPYKSLCSSQVSIARIHESMLTALTRHTRLALSSLVCYLRRCRIEEATRLFTATYTAGTAIDAYFEAFADIGPTSLSFSALSRCSRATTVGALSCKS